MSIQEMTMQEIEHVSGGDAASLSTNLALASAAIAVAAVVTVAIPPISGALWVTSAGFAGFAAVANAYASNGGGSSIYHASVRTM